MHLEKSKLCICISPPKKSLKTCCRGGGDSEASAHLGGLLREGDVGKGLGKCEHKRRKGTVMERGTGVRRAPKGKDLVASRGPGGGDWRVMRIRGRQVGEDPWPMVFTA